MAKKHTLAQLAPHLGSKGATLAGGQRGQVLERPARMHRKIKVRTLAGIEAERAGQRDHGCVVGAVAQRREKDLQVGGSGDKTLAQALIGGDAASDHQTFG